jgi:serine O-acetyltransferase
VSAAQLLARSFDAGYVERQIQHLVPDQANLGAGVRDHFEAALLDAVTGLSALKTVRDKGFDYLVSWQYAVFIYQLSRRIWLQDGSTELPVRLFLLNKALNGLDLFYEIEMPTHFFIGHTVGAVFAKADYGDYLVVHQNCTVGRQGEYRPVLEDGVVMFPGSCVVGNCVVKKNTVLSAGVSLVNTSTPGNCYVFQGKSGRPVFKELSKYYADEYYDRGAVAALVSGSSPP